MKTDEPILWEDALNLLERALGAKFDERLRRAYKCLFMKYRIFDSYDPYLTDGAVRSYLKWPELRKAFEPLDRAASVAIGDEVLFEGLLLTGATPASSCASLGINPDNFADSLTRGGIGVLTGKFLEIIECSDKINGLITPQAFLDSMFMISIDNYDQSERPETIGVLNTLLEGVDFPYINDRDATFRVLDVLLREITKHPTTQDEQCFLMFLSEDKIRIRPTSFMGSYNLERSQSGLILPVNGHLTHFGDRFCFFTVEEIEELEFLINNPKFKEAKLQSFFESHPNFLLGNQYKRLHSQVILTREDQGPLIPDFMIEGPHGEISKIVDLKRPNQRFIRKKKNRPGFLQSLIEARDQLLEYRNYFEDRANRKTFEQKMGLKAFRPQICVIIGRNSEYSDFYHRQTLMSHEPDIEIITYDDLLSSAKERQIIYEDAWGKIPDVV